MSEIPSAGTEVLDERSKPGSDSQQPATTFAEQIQDAINQGASLDELRRHFHLSESELRDYCAGLIDNGLDEPTRDSGTGY